MFNLKLESGTRRIYETPSGSLTAEVCTTDYSGIKGGAMDVYVRNGWVESFLESTLGCQTCLKLPDGTQVGELFNPTVKHVESGSEIDFEWLLEATPDNEEKLLEEIERRYRRWLGAISADLIDPAPTSSDNAPTCDRDALLALAESLDASAELNTYPLERGGGVSKIEREMADLELYIAGKIREACGVRDDKA